LRGCNRPFNQSMQSVQCEYTGSNILCAGPTYGELEYSYLSDDGNYKTTMTHLEFPQNDETRNYYTIELEFLQDITIPNARRSLRFLTWQEKNAGFTKFAYKDPAGEENVVDLDGWDSQFCALSGQGGFAAIYNTVYGNERLDIENFGLVVQDIQCIMSGKSVQMNPCIALDTGDYSGSEKRSRIHLTLDTKKITFRKGDKITLNVIIFPFGVSTQDNYDNVRYVAEDSGDNVMKVNVTTGKVIEHSYMAHIEAVNNKAEFSMSGSRNANTVRIDGFTSDTKPIIEEYVDGSWVIYDNSVKEFDGYAIHYNSDGTYGFSFVVDMGTHGAARKFRICQ